jgi:hypothetical protein
VTVGLADGVHRCSLLYTRRREEEGQIHREREEVEREREECEREERLLRKRESRDRRRRKRETPGGLEVRQTSTERAPS